MIAVIISEKNQGIPSSGIQFCFWGALVIYATIKLRSLILLSKDQVCGQQTLKVPAFECYLQHSNVVLVI